MNFARKQLEKYGWKEGQGLGKNENGLCEAIKPKLKFDTCGIGHNLSDEIVNPWWQRVYDKAANNIKSKTSSDGVKFEPVFESVDITTKKSKKRKKSDSTYKGFVQTSSLTNKGEVRNENVEDSSEDEETSKVVKVSSGICELTDEQLFEACGGRTAHKGARHGLKMNGKLDRIKQHEDELLNKIKNSSSKIQVDEQQSLDECVKKKKKKRKNE